LQKIVTGSRPVSAHIDLRLKAWISITWGWIVQPPAEEKCGRGAGIRTG
jgi:hypothetical protein